MAWVGQAGDDAEQSLAPLCWGGHEDGFFSGLRISWGDNENGHCPSGSSIRLGRTVISQDIEHGALSSAWCDKAVRRGYLSVIALPLKTAEGRVFGNLTIYSPRRDAFNPEEVSLLEELANDLAYGVCAIRLREHHRLDEEALEKSEANYRAAVDYSPELISMFDRDRPLPLHEPLDLPCHGPFARGGRGKADNRAAHLGKPGGRGRMGQGDRRGAGDRQAQPGRGRARGVFGKGSSSTVGSIRSLPRTGASGRPSASAATSRRSGRPPNAYGRPSRRRKSSSGSSVTGPATTCR